MTGLVVLLVCASLAAYVGWLYFLGASTGSQNHELRRIDQAKRDALNDIRRRRERAEDQLRRLGRWQR